MRIPRWSLRLSLLLVAALALLLSFAIEWRRPGRPSGKGVELYSWPAEDGGWEFILLPGTNRQKPADSLRATTDRARSLMELSRRFRGLAVGESVYWMPRPDAGCRIPSPALTEEIRRSAASARVRLEVMP